MLLHITACWKYVCLQLRQPFHERNTQTRILPWTQTLIIFMNYNSQFSVFNFVVVLNPVHIRKFHGYGCLLKAGIRCQFHELHSEFLSIVIFLSDGVVTDSTSRGKLDLANLLKPWPLGFLRLHFPKQILSDHRSIAVRLQKFTGWFLARCYVVAKVLWMVARG